MEWDAWSSLPAATCELHPGVAVTGFCASCLRERLAGLHPNSSSSASAARKSPSGLKSFFSRVASSNPELRRCKSFSYGRAAANAAASAADDQHLEPHRRSCDARGRSGTVGNLFHHDDHFLPSSSAQIDHLGFPPSCVPEEDEDEIREVAGPTLAAAPARPMRVHIDLESQQPRKPPTKDLKEIAGSFWVAASVFSKKWQDWRRKHKLKKQQGSKAAAAAMPPETPFPKSSRKQQRFRDTQSEVAMDALGRRSCDTDPRFSMDAGRISLDVPRYSLDEPRASWDGYIVGSGGRSVLARLPPMLSVVEDAPTMAIPRSDGQIPVEEDVTIPGGSAQTRDYYLDSSSRRRRSFERSISARKSFSDASDPRPIANANAKVSPAGGTEFYHYHHASQSFLDHDLRDSGSNSLRDDISESFESAFRDHAKGASTKKPRKWIKTWNIWGLIQKRGGSKEGANVVERSFSESWPELRARGYNGQMLRCNSSVSARSSFSTSAAIGSGRRSSVEMNGNGHGKKRREEFVMERNRSARYSPSRTDNGMLRFYLTPMGSSQISRRNGVSGMGRPISSQSLSRSTPRLY